MTGRRRFKRCGEAKDCPRLGCGKVGTLRWAGLRPGLLLLLADGAAAAWAEEESEH